MTRWARTKLFGKNRVEHAATKWEDLQKQNKNNNDVEPQLTEEAPTEPIKETVSKKKLKRRKVWLDQDSVKTDNPEDGGVAGMLANEVAYSKDDESTLTSSKKKKRRKELSEGFIAPSERPEHASGFGIASSLEKIGMTTLNTDDNIDEKKKQTQEQTRVEKRKLKSEERRLKRIEERNASKTCFHCRQLGHDMSNCPQRSQTTLDAGICFKCGSTEHKINDCQAKVAKGEFPYAKCFICNETGHLASQCCDNPKGLYPNGGCCRVCGSVEHYKRDCPDRKGHVVVEEIKLGRLASKNVDEEISLLPVRRPVVKKTHKIVNF